MGLIQTNTTGPEPSFGKASVDIVCIIVNQLLQ